MVSQCHSQWDQVLSLDLFGDVWSFYKSQGIPISIRFRLNSVWLEFHVNELRLNANPRNSDDLPFFEKFMLNFVHDLRISANNILDSARLENDNSTIAMGFELQQETEELAMKFQENPVGLFCAIKSCLDYELEMIKLKTGCAPPPPTQGTSGSMTPQNPLSVTSRYNSLGSRLHKVVLTSTGQPTHIGEINRIRLQMQDTIVELVQLRENLNGLEVDIHIASECNPRNGGVQTEVHALQATWNQKRAQLIEKVASLKRDVTNFTSHIKNAISQISTFSVELIQLIDEWKIEQRHEANGMGDMSHSLDRISSLVKTYVTGVVELNRQLQCRPRIEACLSENGENCEAVTQIVNGFKAELDQLMYAIVFKTFLVETQPPQILRLKSTIKQGIKLQLLVGSTIIPSSTLAVKAMLIDKLEVEKLHANKMYIPKPSIQLTHNEMEMCNENEKFGTTFSGITLPDKRKNADQKGKGQKDSDDQFVTTKKYCFYFSTTFSAPEMSSFTIWTTSLPVIVTCHPSQYADAWACILWDNAFAVPNRASFEVAKEVNPESLMKVLSSVFKLQTRRQLSPLHQQFLLKKLMGNHVGQVTWQMFFENKVDCCISKRPTPETSKSKEETQRVTFHSWLYAIKRLCESASKDDTESANDDQPKPLGRTSTKKERKLPKDNTTIPCYWATEVIEGFITREHLYERLQSKPEGTFILYFSEAILGAITVAWYNHRDRKVEKFAPYEVKELKDHPLEERILSSDHLKYLFPNIPKENAFHRLRDTKELIDFKWDMMRKGYIWHTQCQVAQPPILADRQISGSSSEYSSCPSPYSYGSPLSVSSAQSGCEINTSVQGLYASSMDFQ
ncbi:signal transducer and activator of transcription 5A isoform X2 [Folsomia candida]|uniref:signal transducer and activator of transcription 5A isoform X2 n=1 Tax=Folsomia candida TaxID=158441 RepID=UPI000B901C8A|nr:signal transducer and activator of transcription 5A isoform X2 [Folsomia candida]